MIICAPPSILCPSHSHLLMQRDVMPRQKTQRNAREEEVVEEGVKVWHVVKAATTRLQRATTLGRGPLQARLVLLHACRKIA